MPARWRSAYGARIVLAHGLDPVDYAAVDAVPGAVLKGLTRAGARRAGELAGDLLREGIPSHSEIRQGAVAQMLVDVARQYEAGLDRHWHQGNEGAGPVIVGAIAEQLVRLSPCPVLAVAADWNAGDFRPTPGGPVLLAMERNEATAAAVATAYSLARDLPSHADCAACARPAEAVGLSESRRDHAGGVRHRPGGRFPVRCMVKDGNPADAIAEAIAQYHPSMLVAGVKRASETPGPHGTAFALLARSRVPVLCVPPEPAPAAPGAGSLYLRGDQIAHRRAHGVEASLILDGQAEGEIRPSHLMISF